jgi:hypothetical protein
VNRVTHTLRETEKFPTTVILNLKAWSFFNNPHTYFTKEQFMNHVCPSAILSNNLPSFTKLDLGDTTEMISFS